MKVEQALTELVSRGANITQIANDRFIVIDNGFFGFRDDEGWFIIDSDDLFEMYEQYVY